MIPWLTALLAAVFLFTPPPGGTAATPAPTYLPLVGNGIVTTPPPLLISALYYDTYLANEPDETFQLFNPSARAAALGG